MLLQAKTKQPQPFFNRTTAKSIKSLNSLASNPEIQILVDRLQLMADEFHQQKANPLNLVEWGRTKYRPSQSQNRNKIENRVFMKKAENEKLRPKIKPIKRYAAFEANEKGVVQMSYKDHYREISTSLNIQLKKEEECEEEVPQNKESRATSSKGFRYYSSITKYPHLSSYISEKIQKNTANLSKRYISAQKTIRQATKFVRNEKTSNALNITSKTVILNKVQNQLKIDSILKKWRPQSRAQKRITINEAKYSQKARSKSKELMNATSNSSSFRQSSQRVEETSFEKPQISLITKTK